MITRHFIILTALCLVYAPFANAATVNDAGEKQLKSIFTKMIEKRRNALEERGGKLETDGDIVIEQTDTYYAVTMPAMTVTNEDGMIGKIGLVAINATPMDKADDWKMSVAIPTPILYEDKEGNPVMRLDIGAQEMGGIWNGRLENFSKLAAKYSDIKFSHSKKQEVLNINQFNVSVDLKETKEDYWTGPTKMSLQNVSITDNADNKLIELGEARILIAFENFSPKKRAEILDSLAKQSEGSEDTSISLPALVMGSIGDSFSLEGVLKNLTVSGKNNKKLGDKGLSLNSGTFAVSMNDLNKDTIKQGFKFSFNGLENEKNGELAPTDMNINIKMDNVPLKELLGLAEKIIPKDGDKTGAKQVAAMQTMLTAPKILADAGTTISLINTKYGNNLYAASLNGKLTANQSSMFGTTGEVIFTMKGLEKLLSALKGKTDHKKTVARLKAIQKICAKQGDGDEQQNICHFKLDESAKLTVNGQDMKVLLQAITGEESETTSEDKTEDRSDAAPQQP